MNVLIGHGESGKVYQINDSTIRKVYNDRRTFLKERQFLKILNDNNVQRTAKMTSFSYKNKTIDMPFIPYNLENIIKDCDNIHMKNLDICMIITELLSIMIELHNNNIYHGDFKAKNIQINQKKLPIIIDFDLSEYNNNSDYVGDLNKLKLLIIQLLFKTEYPETWPRKAYYLQLIEKELPELKDLLQSKSYNINDLVSYFNNESNKKMIIDFINN